MRDNQEIACMLHLFQVVVQGGMSSTTPIVGHSGVGSGGGPSSQPRALAGLYTDTSPEHSGAGIPTSAGGSTRALRFMTRPFPRHCTIPHPRPRMAQIVKSRRIRVCGNGCNRLELAGRVIKLEETNKKLQQRCEELERQLATHLLSSLSLAK